MTLIFCLSLIGNNSLESNILCIQPQIDSKLCFVVACYHTYALNKGCLTLDQPHNTILVNGTAGKRPNDVIGGHA